MKLRIDGNRIVADLTDEGRAVGFVVESSFRYIDGQIVSAVVFGARPDHDSPLAAADLRRVVKTLGTTIVIPWSGGKPFPLQPPVASDQPSNGRLKSFQRFKRLGVIGARR